MTIHEIELLLEGITPGEYWELHDDKDGEHFHGKYEKHISLPNADIFIAGEGEELGKLYSLISATPRIIRSLIAQVKEVEKQLEIWRNDERARCLDIPKFESEARKQAFIEAAEIAKRVWGQSMANPLSMQHPAKEIEIALRRKAKEE